MRITGTKKFLLALSGLFSILYSSCATYQQARDINAEVKRIEQKLDVMLAQPAPVTKEEAAAIASKFAGFIEVPAVRQPRVIYSHTQTFNVIGNDGKGEILIGINPTTGEVIKMVMQCPYPGRDTEKAVISGEEAVRKTGDFLSKRGLPPVPEGFIMGKPRLKTTWRKKHWEVVWRHYVGEVEVLSDFMSFIVNAETGEIASYSKVYHDVVVSHLPKLSANNAIEQARSILGEGNLEYYDLAMGVRKTTLKILYPNNYFEDFVYHWIDRQALAWVVQFGENGEPAIDVWVDAFSGKILGGEIYESPVPELWGIPDQTADITNIWQPALDLMQYDTTTHTFLGDATETNIVNSITNGEYFILQTHGGTTATAEYARIRHSGTTDAQRLTPDEIPNNNLRYVLMSHCRSAHDGTGQDFRDVFVGRGADVFQGYVESMNPDPYERRLVRYLAEGQYLNNAHWNAYADVSPWFTIVFDYDAICYNRVKLAPLLVDVNTLSTAWRNATITATVRNTEKARFTTATNVKAELILPSGVTIISGVNPQVSPALYYNHSWAAQWKVHAPFWTTRIKTFDVVVWSDNLGVEVDDYDNPYHKVDITFGYLKLVLFEYLELWKWWELAVARFQQVDELKQILSIRKDIDRYENIDDVREDPGTFLELMTNMAMLELKFGNRVLELRYVSPDAGSPYLEAVKKKIAYLKQMQKEGIAEAKEALTKLSAMQMMINATALEAFWKK